MNLREFLPIILFFVGLLILNFTLRKKNSFTKETQNKNLLNIFEQELAASYVRKKELPQDFYFQFDFSRCPKHEENDELYAMYKKVMRFQDFHMCHLKDMSNLEIKQRYGPSTLDDLINYEKAYFSFMECACQYGNLLYTHHYSLEAQNFLEYLLEKGCDLSKCYLPLIEIYSQSNNTVALELLKGKLRKQSETTPYLKSILKRLDEREMI